MKRVVAACHGLALFALLAVAVSGCLFRGDPEPERVVPPEYPFPVSEDQAIANFRAAYVSMDIADYRSALHPDYVFIFRPQDVLPGMSDRFTCADELAVAENMFSGLPIQRPGDTAIPAISSIRFTTLNRVGAWTDVGSSSPDFLGTRRGLYEFALTFSRPNANTIIVSGQQEFYVTARDSLVDGVVKPFCQLRGQRDLSIGRKIADPSWGELKGMYR